jgi:hypothetical protein
VDFPDTLPLHHIKVRLFRTFSLVLETPTMACSSKTLPQYHCHCESLRSSRRFYSKTGRAYPDVSAQALGFQVVIGGLVHPVQGTSASSPVCSPDHRKELSNLTPTNQTVAGVFALLNDYRLSQNKSTLGFINPLIYSNASSGFNDITAGDNPGCGTRGKLMGSHCRFRYFLCENSQVSLPVLVGTL